MRVLGRQDEQGRMKMGTARKTFEHLNLWYHYQCFSPGNIQQDVKIKPLRCCLELVSKNSRTLLWMLPFSSKWSSLSICRTAPWALCSNSSDFEGSSITSNIVQQRLHSANALLCCMSHSTKLLSTIIRSCSWLNYGPVNKKNCPCWYDTPCVTPAPA